MTDLRNTKFDADTAKLIETLKSIPRKPAKRAPARPTKAAAMKPRQRSASVSR